MRKFTLFIASLLLATSTTYVFAQGKSDQAKGKGQATSAASSNNGQSKSNNASVKSSVAKSKDSQTKSNNSKGSIASSLKGLNAAKANANAFLNANAKSNVGKIAAYKTAAQKTNEFKLKLQVQETEVAKTSSNLEAFFANNPDISGANDLSANKTELSDRYTELSAITEEDRTAEEKAELSAIEAEIVEFNRTIEDYNKLANEFNLELAKLTETQNELDQASAEELQLLNEELSGSDLSEEEVAAFRRLLGL